MKQKIHSFFRLLLFIITICGCEKKNLFDYDIVSGNYELVSIDLLSSQGLDLDGDGHATTDLYQEFSGVFDNVSAGLMDREVLKSSVSAVGTNRSISLRIPFQCISEWTLMGSRNITFVLIFNHWTCGMRFAMMEHFRLKLFLRIGQMLRLLI